MKHFLTSRKRYKRTIKTILPVLTLICLFANFSSKAQLYGICGTVVGDSAVEYLQNLTPVSLPSAKTTNLPVTLHVLFHLVCSGPDSSTAQMSTVQVANCLDSVNKRFLGSGIQFAQCGPPQFIYNSPFWHFQEHLVYPAQFPWHLSEDSLGIPNDGYDVIDIYVVHTISDSSISGYTWQPADVSGTNHRIFVARQMRGITTHLENGQTITHELGHFFGLVHTNGGTNANSIGTNELVNGSNGTTAGDYIEDTHADPSDGTYSITNINGNTIYPSLIGVTCPAFCDANGQQYNPLQNEMISFPGNYFNSFTPGQFTVMYTTYSSYYTDTGSNNISRRNKFQGNGGGWDFYTRDCAADIGDQPDVESIVGYPQIWESPDIWNCRTSQTCPADSNQNPGYIDTTKHNYLQVQVQNKACGYAAGLDSLHAYWTLGSTGEKWPKAWILGDTSICGLSAGKEITPAQSTGYIDPGHAKIYTFQWKAPDPANYPCLTLEQYNDGGPMICFLTRLLGSADLMYNEQGTLSSPHKIGDNVYNNNNIATRNMALINLPGSLIRVPGGHDNTSSSLLVQNSEDADGYFDLYLIQSSSAETSSFFGIGGNAIIRLDSTLWSSWQAGGGTGTNISVYSSANHQIMVSDTNAMLSNIFMPANNVDQALFTFNYTNSPTDSPFLYDFAVYQTIHGSTPPTGSVCHFLVNNYLYDGGADADKASTIVHNVLAPTNTLYMAPNPTNKGTRISFSLAEKASATLLIRDVTGKIVNTVFENRPFEAGNHSQFVSTENLATGVYFVSLKTPIWSQAVKLLVTKY